MESRAERHPLPYGRLMSSQDWGTSANLGSSGAYWIPANMHLMFMGVDCEGFGRRSGARALLFHLDEHSSWVGFAQSLPDSQTIGHHAQESSLHPLLRPISPQQVGLLIRPVPRHSILLHHATSLLHPCQGLVHCLCSEQRHNSGRCFGRHRGWLPHWN